MNSSFVGLTYFVDFYVDNFDSHKTVDKLRDMGFNVEFEQSGHEDWICIVTIGFDVDSKEEYKEAMKKLNELDDSLLEEIDEFIEWLENYEDEEED